jgi:hypothetical protein
MATPDEMLVHTKMDQQKFGGYQLMANPMNLHISSTSLLMLFTLFQQASRTSKYHPEEKLQQQFLAKCCLLQDKWFIDPDCFSSIADNMAIDTWDDGDESCYFNKISNP